MEHGKHTIHEIMSQPQIWGSALQVFEERQSELQTFFDANAFDSIIVTGCGSTHYLAMVGARLIQKITSLPATAYPASEIVLYPESTLRSNQNQLLIAVSRSGTTTETLKAIQIFRENTNGKIITLTCDSQSPLAQQTDFVLAIDAAQEESVAQTRSYSSMCVVLQQFAGFLGEQDTAVSKELPSVCQALLDTYLNLAQTLGEHPDIQRFFFLGSDLVYGIAAEAMLKMKEMSLSYSEVFHTLEFRHGPMSMVNENSLVVGLISSSSASQELQVLQEMQQKGAKVLAVGQGGYDFDLLIQIPAHIPNCTVPVLYLPVLQLLGYYRALFNGQNPDNPHNLTAVVSLENI